MDITKYLSIINAEKFFEENNLIELIDKLNEIKVSIDNNPKRSRKIRQGMIITELEKRQLLEPFIEKYWPNGKTNEGKKLIHKYKRAFSNIDTILGYDEEQIDNDDNISIDETKFAYEEDLKNYLLGNLSLIENGLSLYIDENGIEGVEYSVDENNKRIDILAIDKDNIPVVIELKVSKGYERVIGQCLYYKNRVKKLLKTDKVRIIIIARVINENLIVATSDLDNVELFEYKLSFKLDQIK